MADEPIGGAPAPANIIAFPAPKARLRADVPPFDPNNPKHLRAWEALFDLGRASLREGRHHG